MLTAILFLVFTTVPIFAQVKPRKPSTSPSNKPSKRTSIKPSFKPSFKQSNGKSSQKPSTSKTIATVVPRKTLSPQTTTKTSTPTTKTHVTPSPRSQNFTYARSAQPTLLQVSDVLTTVRIPKFSLRLYLNSTAIVLKQRNLQTALTKPFGDDYTLTVQLQTFLTGVFQSLKFGSNLAYVRLILLSPSNIYESVGTNPFTCIYSNFSGYASFQGPSPSANDLASSIIFAFGSLQSDSQFFQALRATDNPYLNTVSTATVNLLSDNSNPSDSQVLTVGSPSSVPYIIMGSVISLAILSLGVFCMYQKRRKGEKLSQETMPTETENVENNIWEPHTILKPPPDRDEESSLPVTITCFSQHNFPPRSSSLERIPEETDEGASTCSQSNVVRDEMILYTDMSLNTIFNDESKFDPSVDDVDSLVDDPETPPPGLHYFGKKRVVPFNQGFRYDSSTPNQTSNFEDRDEFFLGIMNETRPFDECERMEVE